jgi:hypothetical protein
MAWPERLRTPKPAIRGGIPTESTMPRRKQLKNIASGLYGSFISRNNDVSGYWGIGKLCLLTQKNKTTTVQINLLAETISPDSQEFKKLLASYHAFLHTHLASQDIPLDWIIAATIDINFNPADQPKKATLLLSNGNLFKLSVAITDDRNKIHTISGYGRCRKHNPKSEQRSTRIGRSPHPD